MHWLIAAYHDAASFVDPAVAVAFLAGLLLSVALLIVVSRRSKPSLVPTEWRPYTLVSKRPASPTTAIYRFALPRPDSRLGLPIGKHVSVRADIGGKQVMRSYTPITDDSLPGAFELLVKTYPHGRISRRFAELNIGDSLEMKGPRGNYTYVPNMYDRIGMIAGGTGLTPCLQVIKAALRDADDRTKFDLIYANVSQEEILLMEHIDELAAAHPDRLRVHYFLNAAPLGWTGGVGFVSREAIEKHLPHLEENGQIVMCGPPPMMDAMSRILVACGYPAPSLVSHAHDRIFIF